MTSFNTLNGVPATGNQFAIRQILRGEWKFDGMVVSDYGSIVEMIKHGFASDSRDAARKAVLAGIDMEMVSTSYFEHLKSLLQSDEIDAKLIDEIGAVIFCGLSLNWDSSMVAPLVRGSQRSRLRRSAWHSVSRQKAWFC